MYLQTEDKQQNSNVFSLPDDAIKNRKTLKNQMECYHCEGMDKWALRVPCVLKESPERGRLSDSKRTISIIHPQAMGFVNSWDCVEKALARELLREAEGGPDAKSFSKWPLRGSQDLELCWCPQVWHIPNKEWKTHGLQHFSVRGKLQNLPVQHFLEFNLIFQRCSFAKQMHNTVAVFSHCRWRLMVDDNMTHTKKTTNDTFTAKANQ